jgi:redox-sensitive bicupin YhaK (pirin superfamily)
MEHTYRNIVAVMPPPPFHMVGDGFRVHNFFPSDEIIGEEGMSPFFLLDYGSRHYFPATEKPRGVGVHPHRGFETVTIAYHGSIAHNDSSGNSGVIKQGDVQWMTAGSGILHKEYHEIEFTRKGGDMQMAQIWVNLPASQKMSQPKYQAIESGSIARFMLDDGVSSIDVIAGEYKGVRGPASTFTPMNMFNARLKTGTKVDFNFSSSHNCGMLVIEGKIIVNGSEEAPADHFIYFGHEGEDVVLEAITDSIVMVLSGEPINEPIVSHGPFLMNTEEEIRKAFDDYRKGNFGYLED